MLIWSKKVHLICTEKKLLFSGIKLFNMEATNIYSIASSYLQWLAPGRAKQRFKRFLWKLAPGKMSEIMPNNTKQEFAIGMYRGDLPFELDDVGFNPVLTHADVNDVPAAFVADPFMIQADGTWHMFFEVVNRATEKGEIGLATSSDGKCWKYQRIVLTEPYHLSYPYVFEWQNEYYMIPEGGRAGGGVKLYCATSFPERWKCIGNILSGGRFADSSVFRYEGYWYLFTDASQIAESPLLRLYWAKDLLGPWNEHPASPIIEGDPHIARPGGRVLVVDDKIIRFTQDVFPVYGSKVRAFEIDELSLTTYNERQVGREAVLGAGKVEWNSGGMHHIDAHMLDDGKWIACVDGWFSRV